MKRDASDAAASAARPDWSYTVAAPRTYSLLWMLDRLAALGVPLAGLGLLAAANGLGLITLH